MWKLVMWQVTLSGMKMSQYNLTHTHNERRGEKCLLTYFFLSLKSTHSRGLISHRSVIAGAKETWGLDCFHALLFLADAKKQERRKNAAKKKEPWEVFFALFPPLFWWLFPIVVELTWTLLFMDVCTKNLKISFFGSSLWNNLNLKNYRYLYM